VAVGGVADDGFLQDLDVGQVAEIFGQDRLGAFLLVRLPAVPAIDQDVTAGESDRRQLVQRGAIALDGFGVFADARVELFDERDLVERDGDGGGVRDEPTAMPTSLQIGFPTLQTPWRMRSAGVLQRRAARFWLFANFGQPSTYGPRIGANVTRTGYGQLAFAR
jgi:hypothetical protein